MADSAKMEEFDAGDGRIVSVKSAEESVRAALAIYHNGTLYSAEDADNDPYCQMLVAIESQCQIVHDALGICAFCKSGFWEPNCLASELHRLATGDYGGGRLMNIHSYFRDICQTAAGKRMGMTPKTAKRIIADYPFDPDDFKDEEWNPDGMFFRHYGAGMQFCRITRMSLERHDHPGDTHWLVKDSAGNVVAGLDRQIRNKRQAMEAAGLHYHAPKAEAARPPRPDGKLF